jgi:threonine dehydrogenase-like Zn-dependent dehydrogenase
MDGNLSHPHQKFAGWQLVGPNEFCPAVIKHSPQLAPGDVELRMIACGHCESDVNIARMGHHPSQCLENGNGHAPILLGHEPIGEVVRLGPGVSGIREGDPVAVEPGKSCGQCGECHTGRYNLCRSVKYMATPAKNWNYGCYTHHIRWPAMLCHLLPKDLDPTLAALTESMAAGRQSIMYIDRTHDFKPNREAILIIGAGQMAMNILLQARRKWPDLTIIVMARKEEDRKMALGFGANFALPLAAACWNVTERKEHLLEAALRLDDKGDNTSQLLSLKELAEAVKAAKAHNRAIFEENLGQFVEARRIANGRVACVVECTGQAHVFESALKSRVIRGHGAYGLVSCLYHTRFDVADLRRDGGVAWTLRRSADQFGETIREIAGNRDLYRKLIGYTVPFDQVPMLYQDKKGERVGPGPKVVIQYT